MAIEFSCPSCGRGYRVKGELAGKTAKCGKCGNRMKVPQPAPAEPTPMASAEGDLGSWMDEELAATPPTPAGPVVTEATCPSCGATQPRGATLCGSCGADIPGDSPTSSLRPATAKSASAKAPKKRSRRVKFEFKLGAMGSLIRGTLLSMAFALVGAAIWAAVAYLTDREFGIIAWGLGGLAGIGMALGHEDEDGTTAGIIAAFVSLFGIIAAKVLIIVVFIMAAVAAIAGAGLDMEQDLDPAAAQRELMARMIAHEDLKRQGLDMNVATEAQYDESLARARAEVTGLTDEKLEKRFQELVEVKQEVQPPDLVENPDAAAPALVGPQVDLVEEPGFVSMFFQTMFNPIDGLFILLAFFTAYKVGSGKMTD